MDHFERWWTTYPHKVGKGQALKAWDKMMKGKTPEEVDALWRQMILAIDAQKKHREHAKRTGQFMPEWKHPATWLNGQCWLDEVPKVTLPGEKETKAAVLCECGAKAVVVRDDDRFCPRCYVNKTDPEHKRVLNDSLKRMGMEKQPNETRQEFIARCKAYVEQHGYRRGPSAAARDESRDVRGTHAREGGGSHDECEATA